MKAMQKAVAGKQVISGITVTDWKFHVKGGLSPEAQKLVDAQGLTDHFIAG